jgi:hypothetical protein
VAAVLKDEEGIESIVKAGHIENQVVFVVVAVDLRDSGSGCR